MYYKTNNIILENVPGNVLVTLKTDTAYYLDQEYGEMYEQYMEAINSPIDYYTQYYLMGIVANLHAKAKELTEAFGTDIFKDLFEFTQENLILQPDTCGFLKNIVNTEPKITCVQYKDKNSENKYTIYSLLDYCSINNKELIIEF